MTGVDPAGQLLGSFRSACPDGAPVELILGGVEDVDRLLEEYARHNGNADLFRQAVDGTTGE